jgi:DNA-binding LacI/PurR family transcriptional regulator
MANATIYDVAKEAGVGIGTVSRVLNASEQVNPETRARVLAAIDKLGFVPKFEALARARKQVGRIGVLTPFFTTDSFVERLRGVVAALSSLPYELVIYDVASEAQRDGYLTNLALTRRVDGLIVIGLPFDTATALRVLSNNLPTVSILPAGDPIYPSFTVITHNDALGGTMAATYLLQQGHRRIGFIGDRDVPAFTGTTADHKLKGFRQTLNAAGVALPERYIGLGAFGIEIARQQANDLLNLPEPPSAIFAGSDTQAFGVIQAARERGLRVPDDLAIMGFDDIAHAEVFGLTTINQQLHESGRLAVELLLTMLNETEQPARQIELSFTLMQRTTA